MHTLYLSTISNVVHAYMVHNVYQISDSALSGGCVYCGDPLFIFFDICMYENSQ